MFCLSESDTFYLYPYPTNMRKSFYSLSGIVANEMRRDVRGWRGVHIHKQLVDELEDSACGVWRPGDIQPEA